MKILIACEESQIVTIAFRKKGHEAYSCDVQGCSWNRPEWHLQQDVIPLLSQVSPFIKSKINFSLPVHKIYNFLLAL